MANPFTDPFNTFGYSIFAGTPGMAGSPNPGGASTPSNSTTDLPSGTTTDPNFSNTGINSSGGAQIPGTPSIFSYNAPNTLPSGTNQTNAFNSSTWGAPSTTPSTYNVATATPNGQAAANSAVPTSGTTSTLSGGSAGAGLASAPPATLYINGFPQTNPAYITWLTQQQTSQTPTASPTSTGNGSPFQPISNPTFSGATGTGPINQDPTSPQYGQPITTSYNPALYASGATAQQIAQQLGGKVVSGDPLGFSQGSPFSAPSANMIQLPNGRIIDAGTIAGYEQAYGNSPNMLQALINSEITGNGQNPQAFQNSLAGYNPAAVAAAQTTANPTPQQLAGSTPPGVAIPNPGTQTQVQNTFQPISQPTASPLAALLGGGAAGATSANTSANLGAPTGTGLASLLSNPTQLNSLLAFLQAYSGLGSGGGNPTGINPAGQIGQASVTSPTDLSDLMAILMALSGGGSGNNGLYNRSGYSQFA